MIVLFDAMLEVVDPFGLRFNTTFECLILSPEVLD
jgi:hypothetical protein